MPATSSSTPTTSGTGTGLVNLRKQAKYVLFGSVLTWYFQVFAHLRDALSLGITADWNARLGLLAVSLLFGTVILFAYVILLPARGGPSPDYLKWQQDPHLRSAIPALTLFITLGFVSLLLTLSPWGAPSPAVQADSLAAKLSQAANKAGINLSRVHQHDHLGAIGWIGAFFATTGTYLLIFGSVGLLGLLAPRRGAGSVADQSKKHF